MRLRTTRGDEHYVFPYHLNGKLARFPPVRVSRVERIIVAETRRSLKACSGAAYEENVKGIGDKPATATEKPAGKNVSRFQKSFAGTLELPVCTAFQLADKPEAVFKQDDLAGCRQFSPDSRYLASTNGRQTIYLWDTKLHKKVWEKTEYFGGNGRGMNILFTADGKSIAIRVGISRPGHLNVSDGRISIYPGNARRGNRQ